MASLTVCLAVFMCSLSLPFVLSGSPIRCHPAERDALMRIQTPCKIDSRNDGDQQQECCKWYAVECDEATGNVVGLNLESCTGNSTLLPDSSIFELRHLRKLRLYNSFLNSSIPSEIQKLSELRELRLGGFVGPIPSSIGNLTKLQVLSLGEGRLSGAIPPSLGNLTKLQELYLANGRLSGVIPPSLGNLRELTSLSLQSNQLSGTIPSSLGNLRGLLDVDLSRNNLTGTIPQSLANLTQLAYFTINVNDFSGPLPSFLFDLPSLSTVYIYSNRFEGALPPKIPTDSQLTDLAFQDNMLSGQLPTWLFTGLFVNLWLQNNRFSGRIEEFSVPSVSDLSNVVLSNNLIEEVPRSLFLLKNLSYLYLDANRISGDLDISILEGSDGLVTLNLSMNEGLSLVYNGGALPPVLRELYIDGCNFTKFPIFLNALGSLQRLSISHNKMKGTIDFTKGWRSLTFFDASFNFLEGSLTAAPLSLKTLLLSHNSFSGDVPASLCNVTELDLSFNSLNGVVRWNSSRCFGGQIERVNLRNNKLHGSIPDGFFPKLRVLLLNGNNLGPKLPRSLGRCTDLSYLDVGNNNITDAFPEFLGAIPNLYVLIISSNNFVGDIAERKPLKPFSFRNLVVFDASHNSFTGILPLEYFKSFNNLTDWAKEERELYGDQIFITFKGSKASIKDIFGSGRSSFTSLDLSNNKFTGRIPLAVGKMKQLAGLNLNHNSLSGEVPSSFGNLINLESLDLSSNKLSGGIPKELMKLKYLVYLNVSNNLFKGSAP